MSPQRGGHRCLFQVLKEPELRQFILYSSVAPPGPSLVLQRQTGSRDEPGGRSTFVPLPPILSQLPTTTGYVRRPPVHCSPHPVVVGGSPSASPRRQHGAGLVANPPRDAVALACLNGTPDGASCHVGIRSRDPEVVARNAVSQDELRPWAPAGRPGHRRPRGRGHGTDADLSDPFEGSPHPGDHVGSLVGRCGVLMPLHQLRCRRAGHACSRCLDGHEAPCGHGRHETKAYERYSNPCCQALLPHVPHHASTLSLGGPGYSV